MLDSAKQLWLLIAIRNPPLIQGVTVVFKGKQGKEDNPWSPGRTRGANGHCHLDENSRAVSCSHGLSSTSGVEAYFKGSRRCCALVGLWDAISAPAVSASQHTVCASALRALAMGNPRTVQWGQVQKGSELGAASQSSRRLQNWAGGQSLNTCLDTTALTSWWPSKGLAEQAGSCLSRSPCSADRS